MTSDKIKTRVFVVAYALNEGDDIELGTAICHNVDGEQNFTLIDKYGYLLNIQPSDCDVWRPKTHLGCYNIEL